MNDEPIFNAEQAAYLSWDGIRQRITESGRSEHWICAGLWAIDQHRAFLGDHWSGLSDSTYLQLAFMHADAFRQLLETALRLHLLKEVSGMAQVRRDLQKNVQSGRRLHTHLLLEVASLADQCCHAVALEKTLPSKTAPTDVVLTHEQNVMGIEVFALLLDEGMQTGMAYSNEIDKQLDFIRSKFNVEISGSLDFRLADSETQEWLSHIRDIALQVSRDGKTRMIKDLNCSITISSKWNSHNVEISFKGPLLLGKSNSRLYSKLFEKGQQAVEAGATWIRVDVLDGLWQFTPWALKPIADKGKELASDVKKVLTGIVGLHGAVISSGSAMSRAFRDERIVHLSGGGLAMAKNLGFGRTRETIIVPVHSGFEKEYELWTAMYSGEPEWLDWALQNVGLQSSSVLLA